MVIVVRLKMYEVRFYEQRKVRNKQEQRAELNHLGLGLGMNECDL